MTSRPGLLEVRGERRVLVSGNGRVIVFGQEQEQEPVSNFKLAPVVQSGLTLYLDSRDSAS